MPMPEWMKDPKLASDPAWSLARAWYVVEVCEKIMMMADEQGLVKASKVVDLLLDQPGYPSAWLHPCRARFRFTWRGHCSRGSRVR